MATQLFGLMLFGPGVRIVPEVVWHSGFFWIALVVMMVGIFLYHNNFFRKNGKSQ